MAAARSGGQGWPQTIAKRLALDGREHSGRLVGTFARLCVVREQIRAIEQERLRKLAAVPAKEKGPQAMVRLLARVLGMGVETADMLVNEVLSRHLRDRKAVARYAGLTGAPDESADAGARKVLHAPVTPAPGAA